VLSAGVVAQNLGSKSGESPRRPDAGPEPHENVVTKIIEELQTKEDHQLSWLMVLVFLRAPEIQRLLSCNSVFVTDVQTQDMSRRVVATILITVLDIPGSLHQLVGQIGAPLLAMITNATGQDGTVISRQRR